MAPERRPEAEDHSAGLKEGDLIVGLLGAPPAERLVEGSGARKILHAEGHQADPLFHWASISRRLRPWSGTPAASFA